MFIAEGKAANIGMAAVVIDQFRVGAHSVKGAGTAVAKNGSDNVLAVGVPVRTVKRNIAGK